MPKEPIEENLDDIDALREVLQKVRGSSAVSTPALVDTTDIVDTEQ